VVRAVRVAYHASDEDAGAFNACASIVAFLLRSVLDVDVTRISQRLCD
jgi:hypothetical protein